MTMALSKKALNNVDPRLKQADFATQAQLLIDLAQELKADANTLITAFNTAITAVNVLATTIGKLAALVNAQRGAPHLAADATNTLDPAKVITAASDQTAVDNFLNDLKAKFNLHGAAVNPVHIAADATNVVESDNATDLASSITLVNEIKADLNAHIALAGATGHYQPDTQNAVCAVADAAVTLATVRTLALALQTLYPAHIGAHALITGTQQAAIAASEYAAAVQTSASVTATAPSDLV